MCFLLSACFLLFDRRQSCGNVASFCIKIEGASLNYAGKTIYLWASNWLEFEKGALSLNFFNTFMYEASDFWHASITKNVE